ncbi:MAG: protein adenylyltransferase SelO family protein, partial [Telluria sp.]
MHHAAASRRHGAPSPTAARTRNGANARTGLESGQVATRSPAPGESTITADELPFDNSFAELPPAFYTRLMPTPLPAPYFIAASDKAAALAGLDPAALAQDDFVAVFSGNAVPPRALPLAAVYSGHQFG